MSCVFGPNVTLTPVTVYVYGPEPPVRLASIVPSLAPKQLISALAKSSLILISSIGLTCSPPLVLEEHPLASFT